MQGKHAQTILPVFLPQPEITFNREILNLDDGGILAIDWATNQAHPAENLPSTAPVVFVIPGLAGDREGFRFLCAYALEKGFRPVVFNKRGHGGCKVRTPKLQSFGDPDDFRLAVNHVADKYPGAALTGVGTSAGSGLQVSYMGVDKEKARLIVNVALSPGYDTERLFNDFLTAPYNYLLLRGLKRIARENQDVLSQKIDLTEPLASTSVAQMEERLYQRIYGYKTIKDYWKNNNPMRDILDVKYPALVISSRDDPVVPEHNIPFSVFKQRGDFILAAMSQGGHCGFVEEQTLTNWSERVAIDYIITVLEFYRKKGIIS